MISEIVNSDESKLLPFTFLPFPCLPKAGGYTVNIEVVNSEAVNSDE